MRFADDVVDEYGDDLAMQFDTPSSGAQIDVARNGIALFTLTVVEADGGEVATLTFHSEGGSESGETVIVSQRSLGVNRVTIDGGDIELPGHRSVSIDEASRADRWVALAEAAHPAQIPDPGGGTPRWEPGGGISRCMAKCMVKAAAAVAACARLGPAAGALCSAAALIEIHDCPDNCD
ncbi:hypothetical protein [Demequina salsinemoris]|uniref:hypothetical protein n=1 Tax=Demequina salsinemoris TaxID=577470 RepID=UPI00128D444B|nr:hypothetical protein [Demequina salsinemoris]